MGTFVAMLMALLPLLSHSPRQAAPRAPAQPAPPTAGAVTFTAAGNHALETLLHTYYTGHGSWRACDGPNCPAGDADWGDDSLTATVALREAQTHASNLLPVLRALAKNARSYPAPCGRVKSCATLSDEPEWDAVALAEEYEATRYAAALSKAEAAYQFVAGSRVYTSGACPSIPYQQPGGGDTKVKTLESEANLIKAALLLYGETKNSAYLAAAIAGYSAARTYFLDSRSSLYTTYVFDNGKRCVRLQRRFFASVNGDMIWNGVELGEDEYVISADEKSQLQALRRRHPELPPGPGRTRRVEFEYTRGGTLAYFGAYDVHRAQLLGHVAPRTGIVPFGQLVEKVMTTEPYASATRVFWIVDNGSSHNGAWSIQRMRTTWPTCELVHLPVHACWLNQIEIVFSDMVPAIPHVNVNRLRALAVTSDERSNVLPEVPTMVEAGVIADQFSVLTEKLNSFNKAVTTKVPIAQTPKELVWTLNKAKLYRYVPVLPKEKRHPVPLLLVFALMNRPYILDLRPGHSFVEYMVHQGYDLYLLDWGIPGPEDKNLKFDDYTLDYMPRAIRKMKAIAGAQEFSLLGWCIGAILATVYSSLRADDGLRNLILLTAPLDFSNKTGITFGKWVDERFFDVDKVLAATGNMPGEMIDYGARALKPVENYVLNYLKLWDNLENPQVVEAWKAMNTWVTDNVPLAGGAFRQLVIDLYRNDRLMRGEWMIRGERVDLSRLHANLLTVIAEGDHITPPCQSEALLSRVSSKDKEAFRVPGGHIGIMAGSLAHKMTWPHIERWLKARSR